MFCFGGGGVQHKHNRCATSVGMLCVRIFLGRYGQALPIPSPLFLSATPCEDTQAIKQSSSGSYDIADVDGHLQVYGLGGRVYEKAQDPFTQRLLQGPDGVLHIGSNVTNTSMPLPAGAMHSEAKYIQMEVWGKRFRLKLYRQRSTTPGTWWEMRLLGNIFGLDSKTFLRNLTRNHWRRWTHALLDFMPLCRGARKGYDRSQKDQHYLRCLPEATFSTQGLVVLCLWRWRRARGDGHREAAAEFLDRFLGMAFLGEAVELLLYLGDEPKVRMGTVHSQASVSLCIDNNVAWISDFAAALPSALFCHCRSLEAEEVEAVDTMPLHLFLFVIFCMDVRSLTQQIIGQVSSIMDDILQERKLADNPMEIEEDEASLPKHARHDGQLLDKLAMGEGIQGPGAKRAWQQGAFVQHYQMVTKGGKRLRPLDCKAMNEDIMVRMLQVAAHHLEGSRHLSVALDGTRLGNKDVNFVAVGGSKDNRFRIAWAPAQAALCEFSGRTVGQ